MAPLSAFALQLGSAQAPNLFLGLTGSNSHEIPLCEGNMTMCRHANKPAQFAARHLSLAAPDHDQIFSGPAQLGGYVAKTDVIYHINYERL